MAKNQISKRPAKGTPTSTNLWSLADLAAGRRRFPNRIDRATAPHIRRCLRAGLVDVDGTDLVVTDAGVAAIVAHNEEHAGGYGDDLVVPSN